jgi:hypothetical protein
MAVKGLLLALGLATAAGVVTSAPTLPPASTEIRPIWNEIKWPFLLDQWGVGRAFHCRAADCGLDVDIYLRAKLGFCNCETGVADDDEVDRVADLDLLSSRYVPRAAGRPVTVGWMSGRSRPYDVENRRFALAVAVANKCDVVVATVVTERELPPAADRAALDFLNGNVVLRWATASLGL